MNVSCPIFCLLLLSIGTCLPPDDGHHDLGRAAREPGLFGFGGSPQGDRLPRQDLVQEMQKCGKGQDGMRSRREKADDNEAASENGEKRAGGLEGLAEELHGYSRRKGGFSFRFGRRGRRTGVWGGRETPFYPWG
ncbi:orexigenic neuropeptide QRFP [Anolis carolinensis]|uniref:Uncharacterized protein n=1 Tax=Anolis carolinensis TaxID=28377 RepID=A0A803T4M3_ANOCA|nr:PREDICTED: orexigenic neuropeptide QRFP [Anolis carolinensis]|eukprot:XP_008123041.1 PREDICTED: orexigenic neuropeptide QRFP [Anolis carolinensis]